MLKNNHSASGVFSSICRRILRSSLGESAGGAILFFLQKELGRDPFEVLWEDPRSVYRAMEKILGAGAKILISVLASGINRECGLNMDPEYFLDLMCRGDQRSIDKIRSFIRRVTEMYGEIGEEELR